MRSESGRGLYPTHRNVAVNTDPVKLVAIERLLSNAMNLTNGPLKIRDVSRRSAPRQSGGSTRFRGHPCNVRTPYPSPRAFIAATTAMLAAAVVK
jgi:hypothetical protein